MEHTKVRDYLTKPSVTTDIYFCHLKAEMSSEQKNSKECTNSNYCWLQ